MGFLRSLPKHKRAFAFAGVVAGIVLALMLICPAVVPARADSLSEQASFSGVKAQVPAGMVSSDQQYQTKSLGTERRSYRNGKVSVEIERLISANTSDAEDVVSDYLQNAAFSGAHLKNLSIRESSEGGSVTASLGSGTVANYNAEYRVWGNAIVLCSVYNTDGTRASNATVDAILDTVSFEARNVTVEISDENQVIDTIATTATDDSGTAVLLPDINSIHPKEGYYFDGWTINGDAGKAAIVTDQDLGGTYLIGVTANVSISPKWLAQYTVTFTDGDGNTLSTQTVASGKAAQAPSKPKKSGYSFRGWDATFDNITEDTTVNAIWEKNATAGEQQAVSSAKSYLQHLSFSYSGLIEQLEYEGFSTEEATYGADHSGANWNEQAVKSAKSYLKHMSFSRQGLIEQLEYEGFTHEQAVYGVDGAGL